MGEEHDSWFKSAFGVDPGEIAGKVKDEVVTVATGVVEVASGVVKSVEETVESGISDAGKAISGVAGAVTTAVGGAVGAAAGAATGAVKAVAAAVGVGDGGSFPLGASVGRGGKNTPNDVRAVQTALGIGADGKCGPQTIAAIDAFQRKMGQSRPDGRVDAGGETERALAGGASGASAAAAPEPASKDDDSRSLLDQAVQGAKDLGGKILKEGEDDLDAAKALAGQLLKGPDDSSGGSSSAVDGLGGSGSSILAPVESLLGIGVSGQFSFPGLALPPAPGFPIGTVAFGQFAGKGSVEFKPTLLSAVKAPKPAEAESGIKAICKELYENASFKWFGGVKVEGDTKSAGVSASFLKVSTAIGEVTLEIDAFEIGLDLKKIVKASFGSTSASFAPFERELNGVKYQITLSVGGALEVSPNPAAGAAAFTSGGILLAIDVALVTGPPLAAAAVVAIGIVMAGEKADRDKEILEGAVDARHAAFDYAFAMTGSEGQSPGPRAKAAVAVAKDQLSRVASSRQISLEALMKELRDDRNAGHDLNRIEAQARQQIFSAYFAEVRGHLKAWRNEHSVLAAFTTEADDNVAVDKIVAVEFERN